MSDRPVDSAAIDFEINGASLRAFLRDNMHDGTEVGVVTMPAKALIDETVEVVGMWIHEGFRYGE